MKKLIFLILFTFTSLSFANTWTTDKAIKINFEQTDINPLEVETHYSVNCSYKKNT